MITKPVLPAFWQRFLAVPLAFGASSVLAVSAVESDGAAGANDLEKVKRLPLVFMPVSEGSSGSPRFQVFGARRHVTFEPRGVIVSLPGGSPSLRMVLLDATHAPAIEGVSRLRGRANVYRGSNEQNWRSGVPLFGGIVYRQVYSGIDLRFFSEQGRLKREFRVAPGADPQRIRFTFEPSGEATLREDGALVVRSETDAMVEEAPVVFQVVNGQRKMVPARFVLGADGSVSFALGAYDRSLPLVIDPFLSFLTLVGGSLDDTAFGLDYTADGFFVAGRTASSDFPTVNPAQGTFGGDPNGTGDMVIMRLDRDTKDVIYATFLGGEASDLANGIVADENGAAWISGWTGSTNFPVTPDALQTNLAGATDGVVAMLDATGALVYSTYYGGTNDDQFAGIARFSFDSSVAVCGFSSSTDFPVTSGVSDTTCSSCTQPNQSDAVVVKFNSDQSVRWATFLGVSGLDVALAAAMDGSGDVYVTGWTRGTSFPREPFQSNAGGSDVFMSVFDADSGVRRKSVIAGGSGDDMGQGIAVGTRQYVFVTGTTASSDFPVNGSQAQSTYGGGDSDAFIARFDRDQSIGSLEDSGFLGGSGLDQGRSITAAGFGETIFVSGVTSSTNLSTTNAVQPAYGGGGTDGFLAGLDFYSGAFDDAIQSLTYLGGNGDDALTACRLDPEGSDPRDVAFAGASRSDDLATVSGQSSARGDVQAQQGGFPFESILIGLIQQVEALKPDLAITSVSVSDTNVTPGQTIEAAITVTNEGSGVATQVLLSESLTATLLPSRIADKSNGLPWIPNPPFGQLTTPLPDMAPGATRTQVVNVKIGEFVTNPSHSEPNIGFLVVHAQSDPTPSDNERNLDVNFRGEGSGEGGSRPSGKEQPVGDPVASANGAFHFEHSLVNLGGPMPLAASLTYRSDLDRIYPDTMVDNFWWRPFAAIVPRVNLNGTVYTTVQLPDGGHVSFKQQGPDWVSVDNTEDLGTVVREDNASPVAYSLIESNNWFYLVDPQRQRVYVFEDFGSFGTLRLVMDRRGNTHEFLYDNGPNAPPTAVRDGRGRQLNFAYAPDDFVLRQLLKTITDDAGRQWQFLYETNAADNPRAGTTLRGVVDPLNHTNLFHYAGSNLPPNLVVSRERPQGNQPFTQTYDGALLDNVGAFRVVNQQDAFSQSRTLSYDPGTNTVTATEPDGGVWKYTAFSHHSVPKEIEDPAGNKQRFERNTRDQITRFTNRRGGQWSMGYDATSGSLNAITNPASQVVQRMHAAFTPPLTNAITGDPIPVTFHRYSRIDFPDGTFETAVYDARGNRVTLTDRSGETWRRGYNGFGQILSQTNPAGGTVEFTYDSTGNVTSRDDSDTHAVQYDYDDLRRLTNIVPPAPYGNRAYEYDGIGRPVRATDGRGNSVQFEYDANNNVRGIVEPGGASVHLEYDAMDRPLRATNELGDVTHYEYDPSGRPAAVEDPTGLRVEYHYDPRGWVSNFTVGGLPTTIARDPDGNITNLLSPAGVNVTIERNALSDPTAVEDELGNRVEFEYDAVQRLTCVRDAALRNRRYEYDGLGRLTRSILTDATDSPVGEAQFARIGLGLLTNLTDLNGADWTFAYTPVGRLLSSTDPLSRSVTFSNDALGGVKEITLPTSETVSLTRDEDGRVTRVQVSGGGPDLNYTYEANGRLASAEGITLMRDAAMRITNTVMFGSAYGVTRDAAGRVTQASYHDGALLVTYEYDPATKRLSAVHDNLSGGSVSFTYDNDGRILSLTRSNGVNGTYTHDDAGRLTRIQEGGIIDADYTLNGAGDVTALSLTAPVVPGVDLTPDDEQWSADAASQVSSPGFVYDALGRRTAGVGRSYAWDGLDRLIQQGIATLGYNGLGSLVERTESGNTIRYFYNAAFGPQAIMTEWDAGANRVLRYYVWTPGGQLLYLIEATDGNTPRYYHLDRVGSTLALTDEAGQVTDSYAYTPFGRVVRRQGTNLQPFMFLGAFGVRQEGGDGILYQAGVRYYDAATARFLSREPLWPNTPIIEEINPYQYARNRPNELVDANGFIPTCVSVPLVELASLVQPRVQPVREAAARAPCSNNPRQLGLATSNDQSLRDRPRPGGLGGLLDDLMGGSGGNQTGATSGFTVCPNASGLGGLLGGLLGGSGNGPWNSLGGLSSASNSGGLMGGSRILNGQASRNTCAGAAGAEQTLHQASLSQSPDAASAALAEGLLSPIRDVLDFLDLLDFANRFSPLTIVKPPPLTLDEPIKPPNYDPDDPEELSDGECVL